MASFLKNFSTFKIGFISVLFSYEQRDRNQIRLLTTDEQYGKGGKSFYSGTFRKCINHNTIQINEHQYRELIKNQQVLKVKHCAQSLFGVFPSGIFTLITYPLFDMAVRHEFVIIETSNIMMSIEIKKKEDVMIKINMYDFKTNEQKKQVESKIYIGRWYSRCIQQTDCNRFDFMLIDRFMDMTIMFWRNWGDGNYDIAHKNCKSFARSLYHFSVPQLKNLDVLGSLLGKYDDFVN